MKLFIFEQYYGHLCTVNPISCSVLIWLAGLQYVQGKNRILRFILAPFLQWIAMFISDANLGIGTLWVLLSNRKVFMAALIQSANKDARAIPLLFCFWSEELLSSLFSLVDVSSTLLSIKPIRVKQPHVKIHPVLLF